MTPKELAEFRAKIADRSRHWEITLGDFEWMLDEVERLTAERNKAWDLAATAKEEYARIARGGLR